MSDLKITKGLWIVDQNQDSQEIIVRASDGSIVANCEVDYSGDLTGEEKDNEIVANAKLIAAAPELLETLINLKDEVIARCSIGSDKTLLPLLERVQESILTIKKATE